ncbi:MAG TPA: DUF6655 family protein, partial [Planctomicrobium sp.]|nr:DUF6655 family protein [Planctomicrobium sp.]
ASKLGLFAYDKTSREVVWQSGSSVARSTAKDLWVFGIGPFQRGSIYNGQVRFAGETPDAPIPGARVGVNGEIVAYNRERVFQLPTEPSQREPDAENVIMHASGISKEPPPEQPTGNGERNDHQEKKASQESGLDHTVPVEWTPRPAPGRLPESRNAKPMIPEGPEQPISGELKSQEIPSIPPSYAKPY